MNATKLIEKAGGVDVVAAELGIRTQSVYSWQRQGYIPLKRIRAVAKLAGVSEAKLGALIP